MATTRFYHGENVVVLIKFIVTKTHTHVDMYMYAVSLVFVMLLLNCCKCCNTYMTSDTRLFRNFSFKSIQCTLTNLEPFS